MPDIHVTFVAEKHVGLVAQALPDHTEIGAQYDVVAQDGTTVFAIIWSYEQATERPPLYNPKTDWMVIDNLPAASLTVPFEHSLSTLAHTFGLSFP